MPSHQWAKQRADEHMQAEGVRPPGPTDDVDMEEAEGSAAWASARRPWPVELGDVTSSPRFRETLEFVERERAAHPDEVFPVERDVFAAFRLTPFDKVRVVILGQDPYHQPGQAHGLCFSVPRGAPIPPSLRNIHVAMKNDGIALPAHGDLSSWAEQGVLLLNTALTVRRGEANSHARQWRWFTDAVISRLNEHPHGLVFVLWGKEAQKKAALVTDDRHVMIRAPHPAARGLHQAAFRREGTFRQIDEALTDVRVAWGD